LADVFRECYRVLRKGGRLVVNIDAMTNRQDDKDEEYFRDIRTDLANELKPMGFKFYGEHVWYKSTKAGGGNFCGKKTAWGSYASPSTPAVRRNHEYVLVYSKDSGIKGSAFTLEKDEYSGDKDITKTNFENWIASTWFINPETRNIGNHPVPFPEELVQRVLQMYSYTGDIILDPFNGVGTTTAVAYKTNRRYIGIDMEAAYCEYARNRIAEAEIILAPVDNKKSRREIEAEEAELNRKKFDEQERLL
jgi:site-specific DNA-methyltransferase (adenine-specific)